MTDRAPDAKPRAGNLRRALLASAAVVFLAPCAGIAQMAADVPYVTTPWNVVDTMLDMAQVTAADNLIDLGSGDGRIVIEAVRKRGARGTGIELNPHLVKTALEEAQSQGVAERAKFLQGNLFNFELGGASVLTMYLFQQINVRLRPRLFEQLKPGTRVVSHDFHMDDWKPDAQREVPVPGKSYGAPRSVIYMWVMPVNAAGNWNWQLPLNNVPVTFEATLTQRFQMLEISARAAGAKVAASEVRLRGDELRFRLTLAQSGPPVTYDFSGRISGDAAAGTVSAGAGATLEWKATRTERGKIRLD